jgi:hypothetical protein
MSLRTPLKGANGDQEAEEERPHEPFGRAAEARAGAPARSFHSHRHGSHLSNKGAPATT